MGTRATVLAMGLIGAGAYAVTVNWDKISRALGMDEMAPEFGRAIALAKKDYHLDRFRTNQEMISSRLTVLEGKVESEGWDADHKSGELYLVTYLYTLDGVQKGYWFEVDVGKLQVRFVRGNARLEALYGVPPAPK